MIVSREHRLALEWFVSHAGRVMSWDEIQEFSRARSRLVTQAKGIFKPAGSPYALSVRQTLTGDYPDKDVVRNQGSWSYRYHQEGTDPARREKYFTNRGLMMCHRDRVPVGVLIQATERNPASYQVLGLASVLSWSDGFFHLAGPASVPKGT